MESIIYLALFVLVPTAAVAWFVTSLVRFVKTPKTDPKRHLRGTSALVSGIIMGLLLLLGIGVLFFLIIYFSAMAHM